MSHDLEAEDFLEIIYGEREAWIDLPAKVGHYWVPFYSEWPNDGGVSRRIDSSLRDREDLYYSVAQFSERGRSIEDVLPTAWLWADLDEVHPTEAAKLGYLPTIAVQSSPGRYQALWALDRELKPSTAERLNRALSYALDADKGGWDLTQVLRIPGTRNFKYPTAPVVELMWYKPELVYNPTYVWKRVKELIPPEQLDAFTGKVDIPKTGIPARAKQLLRVTSDQVVEGERSSRLWELECLLAESGLNPQEIFDLVWPSAWNKWQGVRTGRTRVEREIKKAIGHVSRQHALRKSDPRTDTAVDSGQEEGDEDDSTEDEDEVTERLPFVGYSSFLAMSMEAPRWLVKDIWTAQSHGIIGGEPKTSKTTLALGLAFAVASGRPFLGKYPVGVQGPVLFVQEENAPWMMQDRLRKLAAFSGLLSTQQATMRPARRDDLARKGKVVVELDFPKDLPLRFLNNFGFDLGIDEHRDMLEAEVADIKPALVVLDPLYLLLGGADLDKANQVRPFLKWLLHLRYEYGTAIALVHHFRKASGPPGQHQGRAGQRVLGSTTLHGWSDTAIYASARDSDRTGWVSTRIETEFRSMAPQLPVDISLTLGQPGDLHMEVDILKFNIADLIYAAVVEAGVIAASELAAKLDMDKRTLISRARGDERLTIEAGKRGRGYVHKISLASGEGDTDD